MKHRRSRNRELTPEDIEDYRRWYEERHPEAAEADKARRMELVKREWME